MLYFAEDYTAPDGREYKKGAPWKSNSETHLCRVLIGRGILAPKALTATKVTKKQGGA